MTREQVNAIWEAWIAEDPARGAFFIGTAFFPIIIEDSEDSD